MSFRKLWKDENGAVGVFAILILAFVLLGFSAIVVDAGILYTSRKGMVTAADAGALAGAMEMEKSLGVTDPVALSNIKQRAIQIAKDTAIKNGAVGNPLVEVKKMNVKLADGSISNRDVIQVDVERNEKLVFANFLGIGDSDVAASAVATWGIVREIRGGFALPIFLSKEAYDLGIDYIHDGKVTMNGITYDAQRGFLYINPNWNGQNEINKAIEDGSGEITIKAGDIFEGKTGLAQSMIGAIENRMKAANKLSTRQEREAYMHGLVPIAEFHSNQGGGTVNYTILKFAVYEIRDVILKEKDGNLEIPSGSPHALLTNDYKSVGNGNEKKYDPAVYGVMYPKGTVIGRLTGEVRELTVVITDGDQTGTVDDSTALYSKLVK